MSALAPLARTGGALAPQAWAGGALAPLAWAGGALAPLAGALPLVAAAAAAAPWPSSAADSAQREAEPIGPAASSSMAGHSCVPFRLPRSSSLFARVASPQTARLLSHAVPEAEDRFPTEAPSAVREAADWSLRLAAAP